MVFMIFYYTNSCAFCFGTPHKGPKIREKKTLEDLVKRPGVSLSSLVKASGCGLFLKNKEELEQVEIDYKYESYIKKEREVVEKISRLEKSIIPNGFNYEKIKSLSAEGKEKLTKTQPKTIGQALRIDGITPAAAYLLLSHVKKMPKSRKMA